MSRITKADIKNNFTLRTIFSKPSKTIIFLPNYGEFGSTIYKLVRIVHFYNAFKKIVCCKRGEEVLFPTADEFYYDWEDKVEDVHRWGFFTKKKIQGVKNHRYREYQKMIAVDFDRIKSKFGSDCNYVHLWKFNKDHSFAFYAHHLRVDLKPKILKNIRADIIITPRYRKSRTENNFLEWDKLINIFNKNGYTVGCIGSKEQSLDIEGSYVNSWSYEDNLSAILELMNNCKIFLGLDTGVSHLASMLSIPMIVFSHSNQKHYLTWMMRNSTTNYFLDLGKSVKNNDIITNSVLGYLNK